MNKYELGRWGLSVEWLNLNSKPIKLNIPKNKNKRQCWFKNEYSINKHESFPFLINRELGLDKSVDEIDWNIFKYSGISPGMHASSFWGSKLRRISHRIQKYKSSLDANMFAGIVQPPQEVHTLEENSKNRMIMVYDIASAYPSILVNGVYPDPANLMYISGDNASDAWNSTSLIGLFRVEVSLKKDVPEWFKNYHPLTCSIESHSNPFYFEENTIIKTWMHNVERSSWEPFLDIKVIDGIVSNPIKHPLSPIVSKLLVQKNEICSDDAVAQLKWLMTRACSANTPGLTKLHSESDASFRMSSLGLNKSIKRNHKPTKDGWILPDLNNPNIIYSWAATTSGYIRSQWLDFIAYLCSTTDDIRLCYANVDSVHISIPENIQIAAENKVNTFNKHNKLGLQWKLKFLATRGLWLSPDQYWLSKDGKLVKYTKLGENWKTKIKLAHLVDGCVKIKTRSIWKSITTRKIAIRLTRRCILQKRRKLSILTNRKSYSDARIKESLRSRNWKKKLWYNMRNHHEKEKERQLSTIGTTQKYST